MGVLAGWRGWARWMPLVQFKVTPRRWQIWARKGGRRHIVTRLVGFGCGIHAGGCRSFFDKSACSLRQVKGCRAASQKLTSYNLSCIHKFSELHPEIQRIARDYCTVQEIQRQCSSSFCCFPSWTQEKLEEQVNWHVTGSDCFLRMAAHIFSTSKSKTNPTHVESSCVNDIDMNLIQT